MKLTERESEIKNIIGNNKSLKKDMFSFLKFVKEDLKIPEDQKLKLADLTEKQYKELKSLLINMKNRDYEVTA